MPEGVSGGPEIQSRPDIKKLNQSAKFIRRIRHALKDYRDARELLNEGRFSEEEMQDPIAEIGAANWNYTIVRMTPEFLDLVIERKPRKTDTMIASETIRVIYGDQPAYKYTRLYKDKDMETESVTSDEDERLARRKVRRFLEEMERDLLPPQQTKLK